MGWSPALGIALKTTQVVRMEWGSRWRESEAGL